VSEKKTFRLSRRRFLEGSVTAIAGAGVACGSDTTAPTGDQPQGGAAASGAATGGAPAGGSSSGGAAAASGGAATGGASTGGATTGGSSSGGATSTGGASTGGTATSTGGAGTGGDTTAGGAETGGSATVTGGTSPGTGGAEGGAAGEGTGGAGTGGSGSTETPLVALVRGDDWAQAVLDAIALVGGLPNLTGKTVMLKPNVISVNPAPETTDAEVIRGAIRAVKAMGASTVIVAEDGFTGDTLQSMQATGIAQVCTDEGAQAVELKDGPTTNISPAGATNWSGGINLYQAVYDAEYIINMPVCKTHSLASFTMALKNWYGCVPIGDRDHPSTLGERLAELHLAKQEDFVILDASKAMVTRGPQGGDTAESRIVVASRDAIAVDVTGLCIYKQFGPRSGSAFNMGVWDQPQISRALQLQYPGWLSSAQNFPYVQQGVDEHAEIMAWRDA
jgi:uncharacterized protein (DUF362 family)